MKLTRITKENKAHFSKLIPREIMERKDLLTLGVLGDDDEPCAGAAIGVEGRMATLEWLFTVWEKRRHGAAKSLLGKVGELLNGMDIGGIKAEYSVDQKELAQLLKKQGFVAKKPMKLYRVPLTDIIFMGRMDEFLSDKMEMNQELVVSFLNRKVMEQLGIYLKRNRIRAEVLSDISKYYSIVLTDRSGKVMAALLAGETDTVDLWAGYLPGKKHIREVSQLFAGLYDRVPEEDRMKVNLLISEGQDVLLGFVEKLTGKERKSYLVPGKRHVVRRF